VKAVRWESNGQSGGYRRGSVVEYHGGNGIAYPRSGFVWFLGSNVKVGNGITNYRPTARIAVNLKEYKKKILIGYIGLTRDCRQLSHRE